MLRGMTRFCPALLALGTAAVLAPATSAATLYGVTATDLVSINPATGATTVIGSLGMDPLELPGPLAWHPHENKFYGLIYDYTFVGPIPVPVSQKLASINPATGAVTIITDFGSRLAGALTYDAIEYVGTYNSLVLSRSPIAASGSSLITQVTTAGALGAEITTTLDNDLLAYDGARTILYSLDPNNATPLLQQVDTVSGTHASLAGGIPSSTTGELAYDDDTDRLYALDYTLGNKNLYSIDTADGLGPASVSGTITLSGDQVLGIAFAAVPEPAETAVVVAGLLAAGTLLVRRTRS